MSDQNTDEKLDDLKSQISWGVNGVRLGWLFVFVALFNEMIFEFLKGDDWFFYLYVMGVFFIILGSFEQTIDRLKLIQLQNEKIISKIDKKNNE